MIGNRGGGLGRIDDGSSMIVSCAKKNLRQNDRNWHLLPSSWVTGECEIAETKVALRNG